jgi:glutamyl-tRNA reductase
MLGILVVLLSFVQEFYSGPQSFTIAPLFLFYRLRIFMVFVATGLNYKTAPLVVREEAARLSTPENSLLSRLLQLPYVYEAVTLSTCNRTEVYCELDNPEQLIPVLAEACNLPIDSLRPYLYQHIGNQAIQHLLRVASGLDSMMLGEPQILGQLKQAFREAEEQGGLSTSFRHLFPFVFNASKRIRNQSGIGNNPISIASAAVRLIGQCFRNYAPLEVFIIGSGETAALVAKYLYQQGARKFTIASRTREHADKLALQWHAHALSITEIPEHLPKADVVISATACPLPFIDKAMVEQTIQTCSNPTKSRFFLDLAVPRDIAPDVGELEHVHLYNIDNLHQVIEQGLNERRAAAEKAEAFIGPALEQYQHEHRIRHAQLAITHYREQMQELAEQELTRASKKVAAGQAQDMVLREFSTRLLNKAAHAPTVGLRQAAADNRPELLDLVHYLMYHTTQHEDYEDIT